MTTLQAPIPHLDTAAIGSPITRLGVSLFPIYLPGNELPEIATGDEARCEIEELDDATVPKLHVHNRGDRAALLIEGEHFLGGKQNRMVNVTVLVPAGAKLEIPVSCLEQGRWGQAREVRRARTFTPARVRSMSQKYVHASMGRDGSRRGNQGAVWSDVANVLERQAAPSATAAVADADVVYERDRKRSDVVEELAECGPLRGQCGVAVTHGRWVAALELFGAPNLLRSHWTGIVRSHLIEPAAPDGHPSAGAVLSVLRRFAFLRTQDTDGVGLGLERRGEDRWLTGQALTLDNAFVHGTAFAKHPNFSTARLKSQPAAR